MKIYDVYSEEFRDYGKVVEGLDTSTLLEKLDSVSPCPEDGTVYVPSSAELEALPVYSYCSGTNTKLNCLEYHRGSEVNVAPGSFVLLLARVQDIRDGKIDSSTVKAFRVPAGVPVIVYETTLHYAPCGVFKCLVVLPKGTNEAKPEIKAETWEDGLLFAANKWLLAHPDTSEAASGAYVGITGRNIDLKGEI